VKNTNTNKLPVWTKIIKIGRRNDEDQMVFRYIANPYIGAIDIILCLLQFNIIHHSGNHILSNHVGSPNFQYRYHTAG